MVALTGASLVTAGLLAGPPAAPRVIDDGELGTMEVYAVDGDAALVPAPAAGSLTEEVWTTFVRIATVEFVAETVAEFQVGDAADIDVAAWVVQDEHTEEWTVGANLAVSDERHDLLVTLIHEYAHLLTLQRSEMSTGSDPCPTVRLDEGCLAEDATLQAFHERFWTPYGATAPAAESQDRDRGRDFFDEHEDDFVSDYASMNPVEDIAESFMTFVLENRPRGDSVAAQKLEFFWQQPEFVKMRDRIRAEFADELGLIP